MTNAMTLKRSLRPLLIWLTLVASAPVVSDAFLTPQRTTLFSFDPTSTSSSTPTRNNQIQHSPPPTRQPTSLSVWWFGGTENKESLDDDSDSCELVAVRIEKTSANSRRIAGDITVAAPLDDVWAILTDYNQLATHVPNLVESKIIAGGGGRSSSNGGVQGDGQYQCRLYQKGAQKIIGFEFGADVTMDMRERIVVGQQSSDAPSEAPSFPEQRKIAFKCVDSFFFSEFDGEWSASALTGDNGEQFTTLSYVVDVRPKGPVPVAALEWRIREDVPTNLRAVKRASMTVGQAGVLATRRPLAARPNTSSLQASISRNVQFVRETVGRGQMDWGEDETMA
eukprot:CAMPEP_0119027328 /NCGR_PEP_ID=MMETSP1176-20130426/36899_1 /TAXON_ID=265551 /ORGANISM="Synedropsis recta cf, Strain CCMP1620" /LENGTH=337 /DNA_ID=CAMNT_0006983221 /DNA_START=92 /DNA_END=1102 /DNA_ORIENTATION=+